MSATMDPLAASLTAGLALGAKYLPTLVASWKSGGSDKLLAADSTSSKQYTGSNKIIVSGNNKAPINTYYSTSTQTYNTTHNQHSMPYPYRRRRFNSYRRRSRAAGAYIYRDPKFWDVWSAKQKAAYWRRMGLNRQARMNIRRTGSLAIAHKYSDNTIAILNPVLSTWTPVALTNIAQGTGVGVRGGMRIIIDEIHVQGSITLLDSTSAAANFTDFYEFAIVNDKQHNAAASMTIANGWLISNDWQSFNDLDGRQRFQTLYHKMIPINATAWDPIANKSLPVEVPVDIHLKNLKINVQYTHNGTAGTPDEIISNCLFWVDVSKKGVVRRNQMAIRVRFYDPD